jgi:hypothetical protein
MVNSVASLRSYQEIIYVSARRKPNVTGTLFSNVSIDPTGIVSAIISISPEMNLDYSKLDVEVNFLQSSTKTNRSIRSRKVNAGRVFYRGFSTSLDSQILNYKLTNYTDTLPTPVLLLNDLSNPNDKFYGDCVIQPCVRIHFSDQTAKNGRILMSPEKISGAVIETVGLSILYSPSVTDVIDEMIMFTTRELINNFVTPINMIEVTQSLTDDIKRYLEYAYYGA